MKGITFRGTSVEEDEPLLAEDVEAVLPLLDAEDAFPLSLVVALVRVAFDSFVSTSCCIYYQL